MSDNRKEDLKKNKKLNQKVKKKLEEYEKEQKKEKKKLDKLRRERGETIGSESPKPTSTKDKDSKLLSTDSVGILHDKIEILFTARSRDWWILSLL
jgi:hypothetical protein